MRNRITNEYCIRGRVGVADSSGNMRNEEAVERTTSMGFEPFLGVDEAKVDPYRPGSRK